MRREWRFATKDFASAYRARRELKELLIENALDDGDVATCELVFGELVTNALKYGQDPVVAAFEAHDRKASLEIEDAGRCFNLTSNEPASLEALGGRGLMIASALAWSLRVDRTAEHCCVRANFALNSPVRPAR
jgi:anti-sigma regulatory factor (Ser/Thr protein kinase)